MALRWDVSKVKDYETVCKVTVPEDVPTQGLKAGDRIWNPVTTAIVWATIAVDLGEITEENASEFYARLHMLEQVDGPYLYRPQDWQGEALITPEEIWAHVGLSTNVANLSRTKWLKRLTSRLDDSVRHFDKRVAVKAEIA